MTSPEQTAKRFVAQHPLAARLGPRQLRFALDLAAKHHKIRLYRSGGNIILSREAMYTPGVREPFYVRKAGEAKN
jgi:hypothetical protein